MLAPVKYIECASISVVQMDLCFRAALPFSVVLSTLSIPSPDHPTS